MECMFLEQGAFKGDDDDKPKVEAETNEFKIIKKQKAYSKFDKKVQDDEK